MKQCCQKCHFLEKAIYPRIARNDRTGRPYRYSWDQQERSQLRIEDRYVAKCYKGVWDTGHTPKLKAKLPAFLQEPRNDCFFFKYHPGMLFPAAEELRALQAEKKSSRNASIDRWIKIVKYLLPGAVVLIGLLHQACPL